MQRHLPKGSKCKSGSNKVLYVIKVNEESRILELVLEEDEICWAGFRRIDGELLRGVPKRRAKDCFRFCHHEGCDLL